MVKAKVNHHFKLWTDAASKSRKMLAKKHPEFKGFIAIRKSTKGCKCASAKEQRKVELGYLWYLEAHKLYCNSKK
jgi:hypothetical protein